MFAGEAGLETPAHSGPLLKGADWMERIGFTAEQVEAEPVQAENLIDPESLNNHRARFTEADRGYWKTDLFCELK